jgi:polo-like kinase 1
VAFEHFFEDSENVYILLEMCQNQTLNELLRRRKRLTELETQCYIVQIVSALKYLHSHRVIHREYCYFFIDLYFSLKLGNLFLTDKMEIKIGDFGLATKLEFEGDKKRTICGTPNYIAPEILDGKQGHSYEVDIWSLGVILYTLLIGKPPFETSDVKTTYSRIKKNSYSFPDHIIISEDAKNLISKILTLDPKKRPSLDEIMNHNFFKSAKSIPKLLPPSTLACPPSASFLRQFSANNGGISSQSPEKQRLESTAPVSVHPTLTKTTSHTKLETKEKIEVKESTGGTSTQSIYVKKWVDYSSKYGLGYLLSNDATGVFFNDSTKLILDPRG